MTNSSPNAAGEVAIIGVGLHPFGRFDKTAMQMGAEAIQSALTDAGVEWKDIQFGFGGSYEVSNPDAVTRLVGLTGITFTNVFNACASASRTSSGRDSDEKSMTVRRTRRGASKRAGCASRTDAATGSCDSARRMLWRGDFMTALPLTAASQARP